MTHSLFLFLPPLSPFFISLSLSLSLSLSQDYKLPDVIKPLFAVEIMEDRKGNKDHLTVAKGEKLSVILIAHPKLPSGELLVESEDGSGNMNALLTILALLCFVL